MTRAYMSEREARADVDVFDALPRPKRDSYQAEDIWALAALREARRILTETEQGDRDDVEHARVPDVRYFRRKAKKDAETRSLFAAQSAAHVALAEALDVLCDAPDTAAWLAFVQRNPERAL